VSAPLAIGIAGLGTVGAETIRLLQAEAETLARRCGRVVDVRAVSARDRDRDRGIDLSSYRWYNAAPDLAAAGDIDVVVELIGGADGVALDVAETAIAAGKALVTANKALIAHHGTSLAERAERTGSALCFEAGVAAGIPVLKVLREGLVANRLGRVYGILNGTCNYILTEMERTGRGFDAVLREAQDKGYAEAEPDFDIDGVDAAHKLAILAGLAFGIRIDFAGVYTQGVRHVSAVDIGFARDLGFRIKLLGIARLTEHGLEQRVHPCMVRLDTPLAHVDGTFNAVVAEGPAIDRVVLEGLGAGAGPTASAVIADILDVARGVRTPAFSVPATDLAACSTAPMECHTGPYYVRLSVVDRPGVIADISAIFRDEKLSIESLIQRGRAPGEVVSVVLTTHDCEEAGMRRALTAVEKLAAVTESPVMIRIEHL